MLYLNVSNDDDSNVTSTDSNPTSTSSTTSTPNTNTSSRMIEFLLLQINVYIYKRKIDNSPYCC